MPNNYKNDSHLRPLFHSVENNVEGTSTNYFIYYQ